jgi:hypothetical protein
MSTLSVNTITAETGNTVSLASGKTLNASQGFTPPAGHVIQTVTTGTIARSTITAASWTDSAYTLSITPTSTSSKIYFTWNNHVRISGSTSEIRSGVRLKRIVGSTATIIWNTQPSNETFQVRNAANEHDTTGYVQVLDSPSTTNAVTYLIQAYKLSGTSIMLFESAFGGNIVLQEISG